MLMLSEETQARRLVWVGVIGSRLEAACDGLAGLLIQRPAERGGDQGIALRREVVERDTDPLQHVRERVTDMDGSAVGICHTTSSVEGD